MLSFTNIDDVIDYIEKGSSEELSLTVYIGGGSDIGGFSADIFISVDHLVEDLHFDL